MIAIIDYDAGNLTSVARAVAHLGVAGTVTHDADVIRRAERIIFPGVGAAGAAMASLRRKGLDRVLREQVAAGKPVLGICLGCQVIQGHSEENDTACLGLVAGRARAFSASMTGPDGRVLKIPHMGWNRIRPRREHPLFAGIGPKDEFYFVHGFFPEPEHAEDVLAVTDYGVEFASVVGHRSLAATQFHLEKSGRPGLRMLQNFCRGPWPETTC
jgi:imidazole glycerol-phosphate synthase subunit HisH